MEPREAARAAHVLTQSLEKAKNGLNRERLTPGLTAMARRMESGEATRVVSRAAHVLVQTLKKETDAEVRVGLIYRLIAMGDQMEAAAWDQVLTQVLEEVKDAQELPRAAWSVAEVAGRMKPAEGARAASRVAHGLTRALEKAQDPIGRYELASGLAALAGRMEAGQAAGTSMQALPVLIQALNEQMGPNALDSVFEQLVPAVGQTELGEAARILIQALEKEKGPAVSGSLASGLAAVARRMEPAEAARASVQAAQILTRALERAKYADARVHLAAGLTALARRMKSAEATRECQRAANFLKAALETNSPGPKTAWPSQAKALVELAEFLDPVDSTALCQSVAQDLLRRAKTTVPNDFRPSLVYATEFFDLTETTAALLSRMDAEEAHSIAKELAAMQCSMPDPNAETPAGDHHRKAELILDAVLTESRQSRVREQAESVATTVGLAGGAGFGMLPAAVVAGTPLPCRLNTQELVELLKMPTCWKDVRKVVLKHLGNRYARPFANHWEFVRYAEEHHLDLDFTTPPKRPAR